MTKRKEKVSTAIATQSNHLIEASYKMSVPAKRVMLMLLAQINPLQRDIDNKIRIEASDYAERTGTDIKLAYGDIKKGAEELLQTIITTRNEKAKTTQKTVVIDFMEYHDNQGWLDARFSRWIAPYIHHLIKVGFTTIEIDEAIRFRRFYTIRFYELLMQFKATGERFITIKDLREIMQIPEKSYPVYSDFRARVIEPSIKEIHLKTDWQIQYKPVKTGRIITSLNISFQKKMQMDLI